jgi:glycosyltransferase involved in cell wall biosynthesis
LRIVTITGEYPPMEGGVGAYTARLASALAAQGHESHILTGALPSGQPAASEADTGKGVTVHRTIERWDLPGMAQVRRSITGLAPDVVNVQVEPAAYGMKAGIYLLPRLLGRSAPPVIVTFHDLLPPYLFPKAGRLRAWSVTQLARHAAGIIVTNREDEDALRTALRTRERLSEGLPLRLIPIGSNIVAESLPSFDRSDWREHHGLDRDALVVSFFGFMNRTKGIETLLEAAAHINGRAGAGQRPVHLLFIGGRTGTSDATNARYADKIDALITSLKLEAYVHRTGFAESSEVSAAFRAADLCALPYTEGANLRHGTLHAALAHGCPTITTMLAGATPELQDGENVLLIPPQNPGALAEAILTLSADPALSRHLGHAAERLAARFTWSRIAEEVATFAQELARPRRSSPGVMVE